MTQTAGPESIRKVVVQCTLNGKSTEFLIAPYQSLLEALRDVLALTGTKEGCNDGNCGACTVSVDGRIVDSCLVLAAEVEGKAVDTIEGMAPSEGLHPLQRIFLEEAALQCGVCTPGFLISAKALLEKEPDADEARIRLWLAGNLCRCTGYDKIITAVQKARNEMKRS